MQSWLTFADDNWDFLNTWVICERASYPKLAWQIRPGDMLCPDGIDMIDLAFFAAHWRQSRPPGHNASTETADFNGSGQVDTTDLEVLTKNWLAGSR